MIYRMVMEQNGRESVSTVVFGEAERVEQIMCEASMHRFGGWNVTLFLATGVQLDDAPLDNPAEWDVPVEHAVMVSPDGRTVRRVWCRGYDPAVDGEQL